mmetsp:Transcript_18410/g.29673  ORF Transcript_18410/g.29673 Transcript_18410/m.29673 type:complete len:176 (+) Transcript_18410:135-662(+)
MSSLRVVISLVVLMIAMVPTASAFGARLEPHHSFTARGSPRGSLLRLMESESDNSRHHDHHVIERDVLSFEQVLGLLDFPPASFENLNDFSLAHTSGLADGTFSHLQEQADLLASEAFDWNLAETGDDCGEDCEECLIPEDWKMAPAMMESFDVMEFLGITRAKPLTKPTSHARQ